MYSAAQKLNERRLKVAERLFEGYDTDHSGTISTDELKAILTRPVGGRPARFTHEQVDDLVARYDFDGDGVISLDEFESMWTSIAPTRPPAT